MGLECCRQFEWSWRSSRRIFKRSVEDKTENNDMMDSVEAQKKEKWQKRKYMKKMEQKGTSNKK